MKKITFKKVSLLILRVVLAIIPFIWIFNRIDSTQFLTAIKSVPFWTMPAVSAVLITVMFVLQSYRWYVLVKSFIPAIRYLPILNIHAKSLFYSIVLPSAAQDLLRASFLTKANDYKIIWGSTWVGRIIGITAQAIVLIGGFFLLDKKGLPSWIMTTILVSCLSIFSMLILSFSKKISSLFRPLFLKLLSPKIFSIIDGIRQGVFQYRSNKKILLLVLLLTVGVQVLGIFAASLILKAISGSFYFIECLFFVPLIEIIVVSLPITPNGIGVREALFSFFLLEYLLLSPAQLGAYVLIALLGIVLRLLGGIPVLIDMLRESHAPIKR